MYNIVVNNYLEKNWTFHQNIFSTFEITGCGNMIMNMSISETLEVTITKITAKEECVTLVSSRQLLSKSLWWDKTYK